MSDANRGPQDASLSQSTQDLPFFVSRSMSAYYVDLLGPLHWMSKCQKVTVASSAEAEIYATDECVKFLLALSQLLDILDVRQLFMPSTNIISMITKLVFSGRSQRRRRVYVISRCERIVSGKTLLQILLVFVTLKANAT